MTRFPRWFFAPRLIAKSFPETKRIGKRGQEGQLAVEYILLLVTSVAIAVLITSTMVSRSESTPGFLIKKWREILDVIGSDPADDVAP